MPNCVTSWARVSPICWMTKEGLSEAQRLGTATGAAARLGLETWGSSLHLNPLPLAHASLSVHCNKGMPLWSSLEGSDWELWAGGSLQQPCPHVPHLQGKILLETEPEVSPYLEGCILENFSPGEFVRTSTSSYELVLLQFITPWYTHVTTRRFIAVQTRCPLCADLGSILGWALGHWAWQQFSTLAKLHIPDCSDLAIFKSGRSQIILI